MFDAPPTRPDTTSPIRLRVQAAILVALVVIAGGVMIYVDSQIEAFGLLVGLALVLAWADRTMAGRRVAACCREQSGLASSVALASAVGLIAVCREEHYTLLMMSTVALFATACIGLNLQMALAGVANFAGAAFFAAGSYAAAVVTSATVLPGVVVVAAGAAVSGLLGVVLLLPILRTRGHYAALVTIAFGLMLSTFLEVNDTFGGPQGMKVPGFHLFGLDFNRVMSVGDVDVSFYLPYAAASLLLFGLCFVVVRRLEQSWVGVALDTVRCDETAAAAFGLSIGRWKAVAFLIGNAIIGAAGALFGMMTGFVTPVSAGLPESLILLSIVVLGGLGNNWGAFGAAVVILVVPEKLQFIQEYRLLIFAGLVIAILRYRPMGLLPRPMRNLSRLAARGRSR